MSKSVCGFCGAEYVGSHRCQTNDKDEYYRQQELSTPTRLSQMTSRERDEMWEKEYGDVVPVISSNGKKYKVDNTTCTNDVRGKK